MEIKGKSVPYPEGSADLSARVARFVGAVLKLPLVQRIEMTSTGIFVQRGVADGEEVLPDGLLASFAKQFWSRECRTRHAQSRDVLLGYLQLEACGYDGENPMAGWDAAVAELLKVKLQPCAVLAPVGDYFDAYVGLPEGSMAQHFCGLPVLRGQAVQPGKLIFVGSPTGHLADADKGFVLDTGVTG